jgi:hypothetical protein
VIEKLKSTYGFTKTLFGKGLAPQMLHRHGAHAEAVARIDWCISERGLGVVTGEVGAGKTVAVRAALANLDSSRNTVIYLGNPTVGGRGLYGCIVTALGGVPRFHKAALIPQTMDLLAAEEHERGRHTTVVLDICLLHEKPYTPWVLRDFRDIAWLFTDQLRDVCHVRAKEDVWHDEAVGQRPPVGVAAPRAHEPIRPAKPVQIVQAVRVGAGPRPGHDRSSPADRG